MRSWASNLSGLAPSLKLMRLLVLLLLSVGATLANADIDVSKATVYAQLGASRADLRAAEDLRSHLSKIVGKEVPLKENAQAASGPSILVGQGPVAEKLFPEIKWATLGEEEVVLKTKGNV